MWLYVDDLMLTQHRLVLPLGASLCLAFCACFQVPLSYHKLQIGSRVTWIGLGVLV